VRLAKHKSSGNYVAIKALKKAEIIRIRQVDHVISENNILGAISPPFIVIHASTGQHVRIQSG